jgi:DNA-binding MarR family transcriptional regulator
MARAHGTNTVAPGDTLADLACVCATARQVARALTQLYDSWLRETGIEAPQFALMMTLDRQGPCSQATIGRRYAIDKTTLSRNVRLLERKGWIESSTANDRRERRFALTAAGHRRLDAAKPKWKKAQEHLRSGMSARQWEAMLQAFRTVTRAAQAAALTRAQMRPPVSQSKRGASRDTASPLETAGT